MLKLELPAFAKQELQPDLQSGPDLTQLQTLWMWHSGQHLVAVVGSALQGSFAHVPALVYAQSVLHICCIGQEIHQTHKSNNGKCSQIKNLPKYILSCNTGNELVFSQLYQPMLGLTPKVAWHLLPSPGNHHRGKHVLC